MNDTLITSHKVPGQLEVKWFFTGSQYRITYGAHSLTFFDSVHAGLEFGKCVRHALECAGKLDKALESAYDKALAGN